MAVVVSGVLLPLLLGVWWVAALWFTLDNGADLGGYGAAPRGGDGPWVGPVLILSFLLAVALDVLVGWRLYRALNRRDPARA